MYAREHVKHQQDNNPHHSVTSVYQNGAVSLTLPIPNGKHIDRFLERRCATDLMIESLDLGWNAKEISESEAIRYAIRHHMKIMAKDSDVLVFVVGDGTRPRTGALLAYTTAWHIVSIDPLLRDCYVGMRDDIKRLACVKKKVEDFSWTDVSPMNLGYEKYWHMLENNEVKRIVAAPHSHADLYKSSRLLGEYGGHVVALPCCTEQSLHDEPSKVYYDWACLSPERLVKVWKNHFPVSWEASFQSLPSRYANHWNTSKEGINE